MKNRKCLQVLKLVYYHYSTQFPSNSVKLHQRIMKAQIPREDSSFILVLEHSYTAERTSSSSRNFLSFSAPFSSTKTCKSDRAMSGGYRACEQYLTFH